MWLPENLKLRVWFALCFCYSGSSLVVILPPPPPGHLAIETLLIVMLGEEGVATIIWYLVEARDAAKHPAALHKKNDLAQNVHSAKAEKPCSTGHTHFG